MAKAKVEGKVETAIPFMGFYETLAANKVGDYCLMMYGCDNPDHDKEEWKEKESCYHETCCSKATHEQFKAAEQAFCKSYVEAFSELVGIPLEFVEMTSPREYNFKTDRIFALISEEDVQKLRDKVDNDPALYERMKKYVKDHFTSRSGFCSFYSGDYDTWGAKVEVHERDEDGKPCDTTISDEPFDHNQICALLECLIESENDDMWQYYLVEDVEI